MRYLLGLLCLLAAGFAVPAAAAPPLSIYGDLPGVERVSLSGSGKLIAMVARFEGVRQLVILNDGKTLVRTYGVGDMKLRGLYWAGDEYLIVMQSQTVALGVGFYSDKAELSGALVIRLSDGVATAVFDKERSITGGVRGYYGVARRDGRWYAYFGGITLDRPDMKTEYALGSTDAELYEVDLQTQKVERIAKRRSKVSQEWLIDDAGSIAATFEFSDDDGKWRILNADRTPIASGTAPYGEISLVALGHEPGTVIYSVESEEDTALFRKIGLKGGGPAAPLLADDYVGKLFVTDTGRRLIGFEREGDTPETHLLDAHPARVMAAVQKAFPGLSLHLEGWNEAFDRMLVSTSGPSDPGTWWLVDTRTGAAVDIARAYGVGDHEVGPMRMIAYKAADGTDIHAVLTLPPGREARDLPVILLPHGGPSARDYPVFDWWAQAFASRGYAVLQPNFRGSTGYGAAFEEAGYGQWGRKMQTDISDGLAELARRGIVDPKRACIMGASYGGYAALAGVTLQSGLYRCAVSVAGVSDLRKMAQDRSYKSGYNRVTMRWNERSLGTPDNQRETSPANFAARADAPVLLIHGKDDIIVPYSQSLVMEKALREAGKPVELITLPGEDHWLSRGETRQAMLNAAMTFVRKHNPADGGATP